MISNYYLIISNVSVEYLVIFWKFKYSFPCDLYTIYFFQALIANAEQAILSKNLVSLSLR